MQAQTIQVLQKQNTNKKLKNCLRSIAAGLSIIIILSIFWYLKLTGITLAGEAFCGIKEHVHGDNCQKRELVCNLQESETHAHVENCYKITQNCFLTEHIHIESCYSDITADLETEEDWENSLADIERGYSTSENLILIARSQLGNAESTINFEVDANGVRRGITRYGQWYGNPYGDWSAMFASFCLYYAGVEDVPTNAGSESMRLEWDEQGIYKTADEYSPHIGDLLFLHKTSTIDSSKTSLPSEYEYKATSANSIAIITKVSDNSITVIEGDVDGCVTEVSYQLNGNEILGYGLVPNISEFAVLVEGQKGTNPVATATKFNTSMLTSSNRFVLYTVIDGTSYAIDGAGNAVQVYIENGKIRTDSENIDMLLWTFSRYNSNSTAIQNVGSGRYLHPFYNGASDNGITTPGRWGTTVTASGEGFKLSHSAYITFDQNNKRFSMTRTQNQNVTFLIGVSSSCTVWLDGTDGGLMSLGGSDNLSYAVYTDNALTLPTQWKSPEKYEYVLKGWYDVTNHKYYAPGDKVIVTGNMVFYADWKAATYDIGRFNSQTTNTISTNSFVTTRVFDYGALFNVLSEKVDVTVNSNSHTEIWNLLTSGGNPYNGKETLNFIFRDWDKGNEDVSYPKNHNDRNNPTDAGTVYMGLYNEAIRDALFDPNIILPGKEYLGEGDYLFQLCENKAHNHYGYYYYNSERNAASYNQTNQRFYVYEYLESTRDSLNNGNEGKYSDFLPLNSPYANTNGKNPTHYSYEGVDGEYSGTTHYMYDSRYNDSDNTTNNISTNFWFGMSVDISFYLPNAPGFTVTGGEYGNRDIYGEDMHFRFTGDDDVWIFVDDKLVLDLGGLHGRESGDINFSTGEVTINGVINAELSRNLKSVTAGEHTLKMYYLERGSSMSNCAVYFNLAPRFAFSIQKEDVLTKEVLNGAEFSVFTDLACTIPAELWTSKEAHDNNENTTNVFTVKNGVANMWGMGAGNVYYIRETKPPDNPNYGFPNGIICITFDKNGAATYEVKIIDEGNGISPGFIVHGFRIDAETQQAYIITTNAPEWVEETTSLQVMKQWNDSIDHSEDVVTVYLTITDPDGSVRRLQEAVIGEDTGWTHKWDNLPKYAEDGVTLIKYGVEESYTAGYYSTVERVTDEFVVIRSVWQNSTSFENGKVYILKNPNGLALSTQRSAEDTGFMWISEEVAKTSKLARWVASVKGDTVRFTNEAGQTLTFYYGNGNPTDFFAYNKYIEDNNRKQYFTYSITSNGVTLRYNNYYLYSTLNSSQKFQNGTQSSRALLLSPCTEVTINSKVPIEDQGYLINNTRLEKETSVTVSKNWVIPPDMDSSVYEEMQITVRLFANGVDTGRTVTLELKNSWNSVFRGLPYTDSSGNVISYSVKEVQSNNNWIVSYGDVVAIGGSPPNYSTTITNTYHTGGPPLPTTGSSLRMVCMLLGAAVMLSALIYGIVFKSKQKRRRI